jgi:Xaa-Pro aminopeptidase
MKSDLDAIMQARGLDALLIVGPTIHNPPMGYLTGGAILLSADVLKKRGADPVLYHHSMERGEAALSGLATQSYDRFPMVELLEQTQGDVIEAYALRYQKILEAAGIQGGRLAIAGHVDVGLAFPVFQALTRRMPGLELVGEGEFSTLLQAMAIKDDDEVQRIRRMGQISIQVMDLVADFLTSHRLQGETLIEPDGQPLTIGSVKRRISLWLAERSAETPDDVIFAIGRDAALPHSTGTPSDVLRLGQTIVFDIAPCEAGGGYFHDMTRTWCLGYASDEALAVYEDVHAVFTQLRQELRPGAQCKAYQTRACELFAQRGHPTICEDARTQRGYVHGLAHGVGLNVHERPDFSLRLANEDHLWPGSVTTLEPGLYYPERHIGVRLEDTLWVRPDGKIETLVEYPLDFVLPMR